MSTKRDREKLRGRVRAALASSGRTQKQLEQDAGWSAGTLSRAYSGKKTIDAELLGALARALGVPMSELVEGTSWVGESAPQAPAEAAPVAASPAENAAETAPEPVAEPAPAPAPKVVSAPAPAPKVVSAPAPEPASSASEPPPPPPADPPPRARKRDLPLKLLKAALQLVLG